MDEIIRAKHNDVVMIPKGFHPVVAEHGFHCYYLNFLAGTDQCLENTTDPDHEWIYNSWKTKDKRLFSYGYLCQHSITMEFGMA